MPEARSVLILPSSFGHSSIAVFELEEAYRRFLEGSCVSAEDAVEDYDPDINFEEITDGPCLVSLGDEIWFKTREAPNSVYHDTVPATDPREHILHVAANLWFGRYEGRTFTRLLGQPLSTILQSHQATAAESATVIPMPCLERWMCRDGGVIPEHKRSLIQYPGSYRRLYQTGSFTGIMNRVFCHLEHCQDFVWIEDDLCLLWMRGRGGSDFDWIRLFPFRVDRSAGPGRLLKEFEPKHVLLKNLFLPPSRRLPSIKMRWYDV